jgi:hypothetical protein
MAGLRTRYASLNNPSLNKVPMLNEKVVDDIVGQRWLGEVLTRLRESRVTAKKIPMFFNMTDVNDRRQGQFRNAPAVRPMLNSPVREETADAELFVKRAITRLDAGHEANYMVEGLVITWEERSRRPGFQVTDHGNADHVFCPDIEGLA